MIWTWTGVSSCSLLSMPMTQLSYRSTIYLSISAERRLFQCHEESAGNLHDKEFGKKLSGLSVHSQPKSGANVTVCGFSAPQFEERLKRRRSVLTELLYYFASFDLKCSFTLLEKPSVSAGVTDTIRSYARGLRACGWRWRRNAVEITLYLSLPSPFVFFFFSSVLSSDRASFSAGFSDQGCEAWNRLTSMWTPDSLIDAAWLRLVQRVTEPFIWFWCTSASTLWNSGLQKHDVDLTLICL